MTRAFGRLMDVIGRCELMARAHLLPSGDHQLEIGIEGTPVEILLSRDQVRQLAGIIEAFNRQVTFEDGGPDRRHRKVEALT